MALSQQNWLVYVTNSYPYKVYVFDADVGNLLYSFVLNVNNAQSIGEGFQVDSLGNLYITFEGAFSTSYGQIYYIPTGLQVGATVTLSSDGAFGDLRLNAAQNRMCWTGNFGHIGVYSIAWGALAVGTSYWLAESGDSVHSVGGQCNFDQNGDMWALSNYTVGNTATWLTWFTVSQGTPLLYYFNLTSQVPNGPCMNLIMLPNDSIVVATANLAGLTKFSLPAMRSGATTGLPGNTVGSGAVLAKNTSVIMGGELNSGFRAGLTGGKIACITQQSFSPFLTLIDPNTLSVSQSSNIQSLDTHLGSGPPHVFRSTVLVWAGETSGSFLLDQIGWTSGSPSLIQQLSNTSFGVDRYLIATVGAPVSPTTRKGSADHHTTKFVKRHGQLYFWNEEFQRKLRHR